MAHRLIRPAVITKTPLLSRLSYFHPQTLTLIQQSHPQLSVLYNLNSFSQQTRGYMSEMRRSAFEGNLLRLLRNEIRYEIGRSPSTQPVTVCNSFAVDERPGQQWIRLNKKFGDDEEIGVEVTMFDGNAPLRKRSGISTGDDVDIYISIVVEISKEKCGDLLEFKCSTWPDSIEIENVIMRGKDKGTSRPFAELDDELQKLLYDFLESRGINEELAVFLHKYMQNKRKTEYIRWMGTVKSIIEKKLWRVKELLNWGQMTTIQLVKTSDTLLNIKSIRTDTDSYVHIVTYQSFLSSNS